MSRIFYDWEFIEDGKTVEPISGGYVAENGDELYVIVADEITIARAIRHPWLCDNVIPHLPIVVQRDGGAVVNWDWDERHPDFVHVVGRHVAAEKVRDFILGHSANPADRDAVELWAWYGAYDHVVQSQLFGPMIELPKGIPMYTNDLRMLVRQCGQHPDTIPSRMDPPDMPRRAHNALMDAWDNAARFDWLAGKYGERNEVGGMAAPVGARVAF